MFVSSGGLQVEPAPVVYCIIGRAANFQPLKHIHTGISLTPCLAMDVNAFAKVGVNFHDPRICEDALGLDALNAMKEQRGHEGVAFLLTNSVIPTV